MAHQLLYGGTFDPIHHGHLIVCRRARELLQADTVVLIPANISPHKGGGDLTAASASGHARRAMIELAIADAADFRIDPRELARSGPSYTIDTLEQIQGDHPADTFTLLIGADQLPKLHTWHRLEDILSRVPLAVLPRPGTDGAQALAEFQSGHPAARIQLLATPQIDISATQIRQRVRGGVPISFLVPAAVEAYIHTRALYH